MSCSKFVKPNISGVNAYSCHFNDNILSQDCSTAPDSGFLAPHNVKRREGRAKARIKSLQGSLKSFKRTHKANNKKIEVLQAALDDTRSLVSERNSEIGELKGKFKNVTTLLILSQVKKKNSVSNRMESSPNTMLKWQAFKSN